MRRVLKAQEMGTEIGDVSTLEDGIVQVSSHIWELVAPRENYEKFDKDQPLDESARYSMKSILDHIYTIPAAIEKMVLLLSLRIQ